MGSLLALALLPLFWPVVAVARTEGEPFKTVLIAGNPKNNETIAGRVEVWNDARDLHVTYIAEAGWCLTETHLNVADEGPPENPSVNIPQTRTGNPKPGRFAYGDDHDPCAFIFEIVIPLDTWEPEDRLVIAAHTALVHLDTGAEETGWARGPSFPGRNWAMYLAYTVQPSSCDQPGGSCTVFVTSEAYRGSLGGLDGADQKCQDLAEVAGLQGQFKAWLSVIEGGVSPKTRFTHASVPYDRVDGQRIANGWADLTDGRISDPIELDENGRNVMGSAWTSTTPFGTLNADNGDCGGWRTRFARARIGNVGDFISFWSDAIDLSCGSLSRLYCFQQ